MSAFPAEVLAAAEPDWLRETLDVSLRLIAAQEAEAQALRAYFYLTVSQITQAALVFAALRDERDDLRQEADRLRGELAYLVREIPYAHVSRGLRAEVARLREVIVALNRQIESLERRLHEQSGAADGGRAA